VTASVVASGGGHYAVGGEIERRKLHARDWCPAPME
jgi:hypothetical protein